MLRMLRWSLLVSLGVLGSGDCGRAENWPGFRGLGDSQAAAGLPWSWELRGRVPGNWNIRLPGYGQSSPVVWGDTIYVTAISGEQKEQLHLFAVAVSDGSVRWQRDFTATQKVKDSDAVSRGAPTPVVDAERIYAVYESGDLFAVSHTGDVQWARSFVKDYGEIQGPHGYSSSPVLAEGLCILQVSHSGPSYVLAVDRATGENRWKVDHPSQTGWSSPVIFGTGETAQVIVSTAGSVRALAVATGATYWVTEAIQGNSTASPTVVGDRVVIGASTERGGGGSRRGANAPSRSEGSTAGSGNRPSGPPAAAPTGSGVIQLAAGLAPEKRVAWTSTQVSAGYASPVVLDGYAYFVNRVGVAMCVSLDDGTVNWQHRLPGEVWASPIANDGHITFFGKHGSVITLKGGPELVEVGDSTISTTEVVYGVAAAENSWIVRTGRGLMRISPVVE
jgi:outer membrane protein assembly factor BamB